MAEEIDLMDDMPVGEESSTGKYDRLMAEQSVSRLTGMFKNWHNASLISNPNFLYKCTAGSL